VGSESADWRRFTRGGFGVEFSYPAVTPQGQAVEQNDEPFRDYARVHLSSPDRQELYLEVVRFHELAPEDEYLSHRPFLEERFDADSITALTQTSLRGRPAWTYGFGWNEGDRAMERSVLLLRVGRDTFRIIYDPRSDLNTEVIATLTITA
jgi:hypothetical protein